MRTPYAVTFMLALLLGGTYWFSHVEAGCRVPLSYRIGTVDSAFNLSFEEVRIALVDAEAVWENATGKNLFQYDENAAFTINFVFDERQALAVAEENLRERLDASENVNQEIDATYAALVSEYDDLSAEYKSRVAAYEEALAAYNAEVEGYNRNGGAPQDIYEELEARKDDLDREQASINGLAGRLNGLVADINRLGEEGNRLIDVHNRQVAWYNETFGDAREFTQGDYYQNEINIYTFTDRHELIAVLAHELGHAVNLGHVENEASIMYYLMGGQPEALTVSEEDIAEFEAVCSDTGVLGAWKRSMSSWLQEWGVV